MIDNLTEAISHAKKEREKVDKTLKYWESINAPLSEQIKYEIGLCKDKLTQCEQTIEWLIELQERREADMWIPVSERLPNCNGVYAVTTEYGYTTASYFDGKGNWHDSNGVNFGAPFMNDWITHWKPLPEAYKENDNE